MVDILVKAPLPKGKKIGIYDRQAYYDSLGNSGSVPGTESAKVGAGGAGPAAFGGTTVGAEDLGLEPKTGVNPGIVDAPLRMSLEEAMEFAKLSRTEEYQNMPPEEKKQAILNFIRDTGADEEPEEAEEPASKFMAGTDLRTAEGKKAAFVERMQNIPGFLDTIFDLHGIDKELAYSKMGRMNLSGEDVYDQIMNDEMPTYETEAAADKETAQMERGRKVAVREIGEGADVEGASTVTQRGRDRGNVFAQRGDTRPLTEEEKEEYNQAMVGVKLGTGEREKVLDKLGMKINSQGQKVKILKPSEFATKPDADTAPRTLAAPPDISDAERADIAVRSRKEKGDKLERLLRRKEHLESQLGGFKVVPSDRGGVDFGAVEGIRAGAQDELEDIKDAKVKFPEELQSIEAFARSKGIDKPVSRFKDSYKTDPQGNIVPKSDPKYVKESREYSAKLKELKDEYEEERRKVIIEQGVDLPKEIQQRIPEYLEQQGVSQMPSPGTEFPLRRDRQGNVTSDYGEAKALRSHVRNMLENDDDYTKVWQRLAAKTGFKLKDDEKFVEIMEELGIGPNDSDFPDLGKAPLSLRERGSSYEKRVMRRPKQFSLDSPVGQAPVADESANTLRLQKKAKEAAFSAMARHIVDHFDEIGIEEANKLMPPYAKLIPNVMGDNERADIMADLNKVRVQIDQQKEQDRLQTQKDKLLDPEEIARMGRQNAIESQMRQDEIIDRLLDDYGDAFVSTQLQSQFMQRTNPRLMDENETLSDIDSSERRRLLLPLEKALAYYFDKAKDIQNDPERFNIMIPTASAARLPDVALPDGNSLERLHAQYEAAKQYGSKEEADNIMSQIKNLRAAASIDEAKAKNLDHFKEQYDVPVTDYNRAIPKTTYVQRNRTAARSTGKSIKDYSEAEIAEHVLLYLLDDHIESVKRGEASLVDGHGGFFEGDEKGEAELEYRLQGFRGLINTFSDMSAFDQRAANLKRELADNMFLGDKSETDGQVVQSDISTQLPDSGTGRLPAGMSGAALAAPLSSTEQRIASEGQEKEALESVARQPNMIQPGMDKVVREKEMEEQANVGANIQRVAGAAQEQGINVGAPESPFAGAEPAPPPQVAQPEAPAPEMPAPPVQPPAPMPEMPAPPVQPAAPDMGPFAGANLDLNEPVQVPGKGKGSSQVLNLTQEDVAQLVAIDKDPNMSPAQKEEAKKLIINKSNSIRRFDATIGDDLLKSIKDRFWRQGY
jgi:hypothetical protein